MNAPVLPNKRTEKADIGEILRGYVFETLGLSSHQLRILRALRDCRTAALGGHIDACDDCGNVKISYNSCRNRHCPKCQRRLLGQNANRCPCCQVGTMHRIGILPPMAHQAGSMTRAPPTAGQDLQNAIWLENKE